MVASDELAEHNLITGHFISFVVKINLKESFYGR